MSFRPEIVPGRHCINTFFHEQNVEHSDVFDFYGSLKLKTT